LQNLPAIFGDTDFVCANLEAAITSGRDQLVKTFRFNSPLNLGDYLHKYKIDAVNLANNHSIDYGKSGLKDTIANLTKSQIHAFGFGDNAAAALAARIITCRGVKIALIGAVCFPLEGYVYLPNAFDVGRWDSVLVKAAIRDAKKQADLVVINLHWGIEFTHYPTAAQVKIGHYCIDQGADLVIGHHPHVLQGMEIYRSKPIFYSLGNFVFDQRFGPATEAIFVKATIVNKKMRVISLTPVSIQQCVPQKATGTAATDIQAHFSKYSQPFGLKPATHWEFNE
jgi:poly-gamma-glutamate capsule biosynthesis protein CapA/YwtB (metallophosphatase superfamily)